jgi:hypothetical protein
MYTVHGILTFIKRLTGVCLQSLHTSSCLDKNGQYLAPAGDADQPCQEQIRTRARKRDPAKASDHFPWTGEMACPYQNEPHIPGSSGEGGSVQTWKRALSLVSEDDATPLASSENGCQCSAAVAVRLLYKGGNKNASSRF